MALIFIFTVIELFFSDFLVALPAVEVTLSNAFSQSVLFRIREGVNIVYEWTQCWRWFCFMQHWWLIISFQQRRGNVLNFNTFFRDGQARRVHKIIWHSAVFFFPSPFVDVLFVYAFECAVISSLLLYLFIYSIIFAYIFCCYFTLKNAINASYTTYNTTELLTRLTVQDSFVHTIKYRFLTILKGALHS